MFLPFLCENTCLRVASWQPCLVSCLHPTFPRSLAAATLLVLLLQHRDCCAGVVLIILCQNKHLGLTHEKQWLTQTSGTQDLQVSCCVRAWLLSSFNSALKLRQPSCTDTVLRAPLPSEVRLEQRCLEASTSSGWYKEGKVQPLCLHLGCSLVSSCHQQWLWRCFVLFCLFPLKWDDKEMYSNHLYWNTVPGPIAQHFL